LLKRAVPFSCISFIFAFTFDDFESPLQNFGLVLTSSKFWTWQWRTLKKSMLQLPNNNCARLFSDNSGEQAQVLQLWHPVSHDSLNSKGPDVWHLSPGMQNDLLNDHLQMSCFTMFY